LTFYKSTTKNKKARRTRRRARDQKGKAPRKKARTKGRNLVLPTGENNITNYRFQVRQNLIVPLPSISISHQQSASAPISAYTIVIPVGATHAKDK
jgi:hypothetical protein